MTESIRASSADIRAFVLASVAEHPRELAKLLTEKFGMTRQAANRHLSRLVDDGVLTAQGQTRSREYRPAVLGRVNEEVPITPALQEDVLWREHVSPLLQAVPENVRDICNYGFTEMVNNAKDHSGSPTVSLQVEVTAETIEMVVRDRGVVNDVPDLLDDRLSDERLKHRG